MEYLLPTTTGHFSGLGAIECDSTPAWAAIRVCGRSPMAVFSLAAISIHPTDPVATYCFGESSLFGEQLAYIHLPSTPPRK